MDEKPLIRHDIEHGSLPARVSGGHGHGGDLPLQPAPQAGANQGAKSSRFAVTPAKLREAFLYRWKLALFLGLIFAATGAAIAWFTYKPKFTATTMMRMTSSKESLLPGANESGRSNREEEFQKTQAQMIRVRLVLNATLTRDEIRGLPTIRDLEDPVSWLEKELQAGFSPGTDIFRIWLSGENPKDLALIVNAVRIVYVDQFLKVVERQQVFHLNSIETVMADAEAKIRRQREDLRRLAETHKTGDTSVLTLKQRMALDEYSTMKKELTGLEMEMRKTEAQLSVYDAEKKGIDDEKLPKGMLDEHVEAHPQVQKDQQEITRIEGQIKEYRKVLTDSSPRLLELQDQLKKAQTAVQKAKIDLQPEVMGKLRVQVRRQLQNVIDSTKVKLSILEKQRTVVDGQVRQLGREAEKFGLGSIEIELRRSDYEEAQNVLRKLRAEKERLEIEKYNKKQTVSNEQEADVPTVNQASLTKTCGMYSFFGLLLGVLGVSYLEARFHRLHQTAVVHQELGIQTLGVLPQLARKKGGTYGTALAARDSVPGLLFTDAVNGLCTRLLCDDRLGQSAVIMVTSAVENEGKTTLASQLVLGLARSGRRSLLLDCDFRSPSCQKQFGMEAGPGLSEVLRGELELADALKTIPGSEAQLLMAGQCDPQVIKALNDGKFAALLKRLRHDFDCIIIDSAPTPVVSDGFLIGKLADGVILVVRAKVSKGPTVLAALEQLSALKISTLGVVVNCNPSGASTYYS